MKVKHLSLAALLMLPAIASAHPGHGLDNAYAGFMHPLTGWDHLLVMLAVGLWAGRLGGNMRWQLPITFISMMAVGTGLGMAGLAWNSLETAIAASVMAMGMLLLMTTPLKPSIRIALIAIFAVLHGMAHGAELASSLPTMLAMLCTTSLLHIAGLLMATQRIKVAKSLHTAIGFIMLGVGGYLLIA